MTANRDRIREKMEEFSLDVLVASYPENVAYLADFQSHFPFVYRFFNMASYVIYPRSNDIEPCLIIPNADIGWVARYPSWIKEVLAYGSSFYTFNPEGDLCAAEKNFKNILDEKSKSVSSASSAIVTMLTRKGLKNAKIGLDEKNITLETRARIATELPDIKMIDASELFRLIRMVKTPEEQNRLRRAGTANERVAKTIMARIKQDMLEEELAQLFLESISKEGAIPEFWNTSCGANSSMLIMSCGHLYPPSFYRIKNGDMIRYDAGCILNKYHADIGLCAVSGLPAEKQKKSYKAIEKGMSRAIELLKPGVLPSRILEEVVSTAEKEGLKEYSKLATFCGHGIGLEVRDYPVFTRPARTDNPFLKGSYDIPLEENMVINIEVPYKELGLGGFQIEYTLLIKKDQCEMLYPQERELFVC